jgi:hypothetical protein
MTNFVPYLSEEQIERDATALLAEYAQSSSSPPPRVRRHPHAVRRATRFQTRRRYPRRDVLRLGPDRDRPKPRPGGEPGEGRPLLRWPMRAAGIGPLHRHLFAKDPAQVAFFGAPTSPSIFCRSSQSKERVEWQADFHASCLLMPRKLIFDAWESRACSSRKCTSDTPMLRSLAPSAFLASSSNRRLKRLKTSQSRLLKSSLFR